MHCTHMRDVVGCLAKMVTHSRVIYVRAKAVTTTTTLWALTCLWRLRWCTESVNDSTCVHSRHDSGTTELLTNYIRQRTTMLWRNGGYLDWRRQATGTSSLLWALLVSVSGNSAAPGKRAGNVTALNIDVFIIISMLKCLLPIDRR